VRVTRPCTALPKGADLLPNTNQTLSLSLPALRQGHRKRVRGAGNEPKRERPRGEWRSILLGATRWLRHQLDLLDRLFEDGQRGEGYSQMRHDYPVCNALGANGHVAHGFQTNMNNSVIGQTKSAYPVGENDWGTHAAEGRSLTSLARNALVKTGGFALGPSGMKVSLGVSIPGAGSGIQSRRPHARKRPPWATGNSHE
jgi:hypothetical protein